jgi:hypothetical protein
MGVRAIDGADSAERTAFAKALGGACCLQEQV